MRAEFLVRPTLAAVLAGGLSVFVSGGALAKTCDTTGHPLDISATGLAFGNYSPGSAAATDANSTIKVYCATSSYLLPSFTIALSAGGAGVFNPRQMSSGAQRLDYNMYTTSSYTVIWGDGTSGTSTQSYNATQDLSTVSFTDYGQASAKQFPTAGAYTDTITVTVTF